MASRVPTTGPPASKVVFALSVSITNVSFDVRLAISKYSRSRTVTVSVPLATQVKGPSETHELVALQ